MATIKQKKAFNKIIENHGNVSKSMREVGYANNTAINPKKNLIETRGFQELCEEKGLTDEFLVNALKEDIEKKPQNRKSELELGFKVKGRLKENNEGTTNILAIFADEQRERVIRRILSRSSGGERTLA